MPNAHLEHDMFWLKTVTKARLKALAEVVVLTGKGACGEPEPLAVIIPYARWRRFEELLDYARGNGRDVEVPEL